MCCGTATNGTDYTTIPTTVTFAAGSSTATVTVDPIADTLIEENETVALTLATGTGYTIGTPGSVTSTILNDDGVINQQGTPGNDLIQAGATRILTLPTAAALARPSTPKPTVSGELKLRLVRVNVYTKLVVPSSCTEAGLTLTDTVGRFAAAKALNTLSRLQDTVLPARAAIESPVLIKVFFTCWAVQVGFCDHNKAAAPATWGLAIDVPERVAYPPPGARL